MFDEYLEAAIADSKLLFYLRRIGIPFETYFGTFLSLGLNLLSLLVRPDLGTYKHFLCFLLFRGAPSRILVYCTDFSGYIHMSENSERKWNWYLNSEVISFASYLNTDHDSP